MLWIVVGNQGSGKTNFVVKEAYNYYLKGYKIISNIHLNFPYEPLDYKKVINCEYDHAVIVLDEIHQLLNSRSTMSKVNKSITSSFCSMLRKKDIILLGTTQREGKVDRRLRSEMTFLCSCDRFVFQNNTFVYKPYDDNTTDANTPTFIRVKVTDVNTRNTVNHYFCANEIFNMYNSKEVVLIKGLDEYFEKPKKAKTFKGTEQNV